MTQKQQTACVVTIGPDCKEIRKRLLYYCQSEKIRCSFRDADGDSREWYCRWQEKRPQQCYSARARMLALKQAREFLGNVEVSK